MTAKSQMINRKTLAEAESISAEHFKISRYPKRNTSQGLSPIGTQCEPMGLKLCVGKERFYGTDAIRPLLKIFKRKST